MDRALDGKAPPAERRRQREAVPALALPRGTRDRQPIAGRASSPSAHAAGSSSGRST
jgi:hypothetical protein